MPLKFPRAILAVWLIAAPVTLIASLFLYSSLNHRAGGLVLGASDGPDSRFASVPPNLGGIGGSIKSGDARPYLIDKFLTNYGSPMIGKGSFIVATADRYHIDWRIVTAIAFQESGLGRTIPPGSNNAWGWGIFTGKNSGATFHSWEFAIDTVSQGIAQKYFSRGLNTPRQIEPIYAPASQGSWAAGVQEAMDEISD